MFRILFGLVSLTLLSWSGFGQSGSVFKSYKTHEDYCRDNPKMPTCLKIGPLDNLSEAGLYKGPIIGAPITGRPKTGGATRRPASSQQRQQPLQRRSAADVTLHDWRFSHQSPAMLVNVNIKSLVQSPIWTSLFSTWTAGGAVELDKARSALSDIGQVLISISPSRTKSPSVLMMAMGNVDSALGAMLRSGAGMEAKRLNAFSMLIGDPDSLQMASHRMQSTIPRTTWNSLQQTATLESMKYDVWLGIDPRYLLTIGSMLDIAPSPAMSMLTNLRGVSLGIYLRDQIRIEGRLEAPSPEIAERMIAAYRQRKESNDHVWVAAEGATVRYIAIVEARELTAGAGLDSATAQRIAPHIGSVIQALAKLSGAPRPDSSELPKQPPGVIVIQGLGSK